MTGRSPCRGRIWRVEPSAWIGPERDTSSSWGGPDAAPAAEAGRRLEVLLDLIGCLSTPPSGYLMDPAYRGLLNEDELRLSGELARLAEAVPCGDSSTAASEEVAGLLRRLG